MLGQGSFIPGFEEGLNGAKAGEERVVNATFPADYPVEALAGKEASFDVKVKEVAAPAQPAIDDEFAKTFGAESLDKLKELVSEQIAARIRHRLAHEAEARAAGPAREGAQLRAAAVARRQRVRGHLAPVQREPAPGRQDLRRRGQDRGGGARRVPQHRGAPRAPWPRVGEIGEKNDIKITQDELRRALIEQARRFPGQEKAVYEYYEKTPGALAELRAPIFEDKVVDFVIEKVKPTEKKVAKDELFEQAEAATAARR